MRRQAKRNDNKILQPKAHEHTVANTYTHASEWQAKLHENHFWCCLFSARQWPLHFFEYRKADTRAHTIHQKIWRPLHRPRKKKHWSTYIVLKNRTKQNWNERACVHVRACVRVDVCESECSIFSQILCVRKCIKWRNEAKICCMALLG